MSSHRSQPLSEPIVLHPRGPEACVAAELGTVAATDALLESLVERARNGDLGAWTRLYQETFDRVFRHVCYLTGDPLVAEDLVQDAYARAMTSIANYDRRSSFTGWVKGIALNLVRMHWRRAKTTDRVHGHLQQMTASAPSQRGCPDHEHLRGHRMKVVYEILAEMPETLREAFILRELEGLSPEEASEQLGISAGNVAVRASRARAKLRKELARRGWLGGASP